VAAFHDQKTGAERAGPRLSARAKTTDFIGEMRFLPGMTGAKGDARAFGTLRYRRYQIALTRNRPDTDGDHGGHTADDAVSTNKHRRRIHMRKISLYVVATFLILTGVGGWIATSTQARVDTPAVAEGIDPSKIMMNAHDLPTEEFSDYTFVFNH
jgi:hypothetical protein